MHQEEVGLDLGSKRFVSKGS